MPTDGMLWYGTTSPSGLPYGSGRSNTPFTSAKIATVAAIPMTSVMDAVTVNAGLRRRDRHAGRTMDDSDDMDMGFRVSVAGTSRLRPRHMPGFPRARPHQLRRPVRAARPVCQHRGRDVLSRIEGR